MIAAPEARPATRATAKPRAVALKAGRDGAPAGMPRFLAGRPVAVSQPSDASEGHADRVADRVMSADAAGDLAAAAPCPSCAPGAPCAGCGAGGSGVQRAAEGAAPRATFAPALGGGQPLDSASRGFFEPRFGRDLGGVRVHAGPDDGALARSFSARAFATGNDVVFGSGEYAPGSDSGRRLIAHELAHVVDPAPGGAVEREAAVGDPVVLPPVASSGPAGGPLDAGPAPAPAAPATPVVATPAATPTAATTPAAAATPTAAATSALDAGVPADAGLHDAAPEPLPGGLPAPEATGMFDGLYGACGTPAEGLQRDAFALRHFHLDRNIPSTTFGMFDADYFPIAGIMPVTVNIKFNFVDADTAPGLLDGLLRALGGEDLSRFFWTDTEKADFKREYIARVSARWSFQHLMASTKPCWAFTARPFVSPHEVDSDAAAHYVATVHKSPGPGIDYKSGTNDPDTAHPNRPATTDLYSSDVKESPDFQSANVALSERQRIEGALAGAVASPVLFDQDSDTIRPAAAAALTTFASGCKAKNPSDPLIPLKLDAFASREGGLTHNVDLANRRAVAVRDFLAGLGVPQPIGVLGHGPVGAPGDAANRKVDITVDHAFESSYASNRYSVGEHEFGHMLGLPDEYQNNTTGTLGAQQTLYTGLVTSAGVPGPSAWGVFTSSQMAGGVDILLRHYLTLWEALGRMTDPDITQSQWSLR